MQYAYTVETKCDIEFLALWFMSHSQKQMDSPFIEFLTWIVVSFV